jgi:hypothetical protein
MLCTQLLPELAANLIAALPNLQRDDLSWHGSLLVQKCELLQRLLCNAVMRAFGYNAR